MEVLKKLDHGASSQTVMNQYGGYLGGTEKDLCGEFGADPNDVHDWLSKDEDDFGNQNLTEEEIALVEEAGSSEKDEEAKKAGACAKLKFSEVK